METEMES